ncbi:MAG: dephospho-CoA kinase [Coriobacteriaceae bacterium]|nr:dephospho-CoA kinase [Coriobacteriaceae bacterium]
MKTIFIIGNIASGKSAAARHLEGRGARRIDLDELARSLYQPGTPLVQQIAEEFGWDVLDADGMVRRDLLARRAFASPADVERLNALVHPILIGRLADMLVPGVGCSASMPQAPCTVVEVSAPRGFEAAFGLADAVIAITAPLEVRRARAIERGMDGADFDRRAGVQPAEEDLAALADVVIDNTAAADSLFIELDRALAALGVELGAAVPGETRG